MGAAASSIIEAQAIFGISRIERNEGRSGFEDGDDGDNGLRTAFEADPDEGAGAGSQGLEPARQAVGLAVQFRVGQGTAAEENGGGIGRTERLGFEQVMRALGFIEEDAAAVPGAELSPFRVG